MSGDKTSRRMLTNDELAPNVAETAAAVERAVADSQQVAADRQRDAETFITEYGAAVTGGHGPVGRPADAASDPDQFPDAADVG
jgi:hypothetical protein